MREEQFFKGLKKSLAGSKAAKIGVALSGGLDSIVLAEALWRLQVPLVVLHVDHGWRGKQSAADAAWVQDWCRQRKIPCYSKKLGSSTARTEGAARDARLDFFRSVSEKRKLDEIWLGHHADDLVETFLLQLLRGAGPEGLASMPERRRMGKMVLVRPLLEWKKADLKNLALGWKLKWREDRSNRSTDYLRNRVRLGLLPYLKKVGGRDPLPALARCARIISDENEHWEELLPDSWPATLSCQPLRKGSIALQRRMIRSWLLSRDVADLSFDDIEAVRGLLLQEKPSKINLSRDRHCRRQGGFLFVE